VHDVSYQTHIARARRAERAVSVEVEASSPGKRAIDTFKTRNQD
jgi:hypothetical protein